MVFEDRGSDGSPRCAEDTDSQLVAWPLLPPGMTLAERWQGREAEPGRPGEPPGLSSVTGEVLGVRAQSGSAVRLLDLAFSHSLEPWALWGS